MGIHGSMSIEERGRTAIQAVCNSLSRQISRQRGRTGEEDASRHSQSDDRKLLLRQVMWWDAWNTISRFNSKCFLQWHHEKSIQTEKTSQARKASSLHWRAVRSERRNSRQIVESVTPPSFVSWAWHSFHSTSANRSYVKWSSSPSTSSLFVWIDHCRKTHTHTHVSHGRRGGWITS